MDYKLYRTQESVCTDESLQVNLWCDEGSVMGSKFFILSINDICFIFFCYFGIFEGDTNIFFSEEDMQQILQTVIKEMLFCVFNDQCTF